ncbi:DUF4041 domain-containing protein [Aliarcobacter butzleri]|uniref:DUF4041 domain-containing protein n=1 Tax=Aliarcobacter butzleri TaxID=28197 RepID=UPI001EDFB7A4|nr:DUF4041 domain-containing protein [Aliarcobacter butzleri]MCG3698845.1 DUF4041 domain-containing protein [Aliarcobacter butzleri]
MEALLVIIILGFIIYSVYIFIKMNIKTRSLNKELNKLEEEIITKRNDLNNIEESTEALKNELNSTKEELKEVLSLKGKNNELETKMLELNTKIDKLEKDLDDKTNQYLDLENEISEIQDSIVLFSPTAHLIDLGFYEEPKYLYETSERYKTEIQLVREKLKTLITNNETIDIPNNIIAIEDNSLSKKILSGQAKLMLRTFNIETDLLLLNLKVTNFAKTMERIEKIATDIEKSAISLKCGFNEEYIKLKLEECQLQYQFKLKQAAEQEEQKAIREQMAEEQKAIRDFERAIAKAQKDEQMYQDALELAKKQLQIADDKEKELLNMKIANLEAKLQDTIENEKRAKSMAEQTKRGYVYVISNIGSFGEDIYKIGMTRRLEPLDRVKELGDASVPFFFDVHALIFSEDAPKLEKELHKVFDNQRVNMINQRREFFNVTLEEIKKEVEKNHGEIEFTMIAQADEYRETLNIKNSMAS